MRWLTRITEELDRAQSGQSRHARSALCREPDRAPLESQCPPGSGSSRSAPNGRGADLDHLARCARVEVNEAAHSCGGITLHDIINNRFAKKAIEKGADGLIAVAAGAGGHAGAQSPLALISEIREWFDGPLALSGAIANGRSILAAQAMGADLAYIGSPFIATEEANAVQDYKDMIVASGAEDIVYSNLFTGVHGNYLKPSIARAGMDPDKLEVSDPSKMNFGENREKPKSWKEIWGSGQGIGAVKQVLPAAKLVDRFATEYATARKALCNG